MTVPVNTPPTQLNGDGGTVAFPTTFVFSDESELVVTLTNTTSGELDGIAAGADEVQTLTTHYTVSGGGGTGSPATGTVTMLTAPSTGIRVTIDRILPFEQQTDYEENDPFPAQTHELALDKVVMLLQQINAVVGRSLSMPDTDLSTLDMTLPNADDRASARLGFDSSGEPIAVTADVTGVAATAYGQAVAEAGSYAAIWTLLATASEATVIKQGTHTIGIPANAMTARTTSGAAQGETELTTNKVMQKTFDFDGSSDEFVQFTVPMPKGWDEGTVTAEFLWTGDAGAGGVTWAIQALALGDDDAMDAAFGTAITVDDTFIAADDLHISAESAAITPAGTPAAGDLVIFQIYRDVSDPNDTKSEDARLIGVRLFYTIDAADDS